MTTIAATLLPLVRVFKSRYPWMPSSIAIGWARFTLNEVRLPFEEHGETISARFERDGFTVHVEYKPDTVADTSHWGTYTDVRTKNAVKNPNGWSGDMTERNGRFYAWIDPCNDPDEEWRYLKATHSRHDAWLISRQHQAEDVRHLRAYNYDDGCDTYTLWWLDVRVSLSDVELGRETLHNIDLGEWNAWEEHATSVAEDSIDMAIEEARERLLELSKNAKAVLL